MGKFTISRLRAVPAFQIVSAPPAPEGYVCQ
jgi:hypothetical protein